MEIQTTNPINPVTDKSGSLNDETRSRELQLQQKSRDLEAIFLTQLFKVMEKTIGKGGLTDSNNNLSSMMFSTVMGQAVADQGGVGLSDMIYRSLADKQEIPEEISSHFSNKIDLLSKIEYLRPNDE